MSGHDELEAAVSASAPPAHRERLLDATRAAVQAWPAITVRPDAWARWLLDRFDADEGALDAAGLYLCCGCAGQDAAALSAFDEVLHAAARGALARTRANVALDEVVQALRVQLLVKHGAEPLKLEAWSGRAPLRAWLSTLAARRAFDLTKSKREALATTAPDEPVASGDPERHVVAADQRAKVQHALAAGLATLTPRQRALLRLSVVEKLSIDDLAPMFGSARSTVARWLDEARAAVGLATRAELAHHLDASTIESLLHQSLDLSLERLLRQAHDADGAG